MSKDLSTILDGWDYKPGTVSARWIEDQGGKRKIQLRLDLGVLQMEVDGRPDGSLPHGYPSLYDYYQNQERKLDDNAEMTLGSAQCAELQQEAVQYYYRYLAFAALHYPEGVIRDTQHNLELFDLVDCYAEDDRLAWQFLQFFPYVRMMNARARAEKAMEKDMFEEAMEAVNEALRDIRHFAEVHELDADDSEEFHEVEILMELLDQIKQRKPKSRAEILREEMDLAIRNENYEQAAKLRDALNEIEQF